MTDQGYLIGLGSNIDPHRNMRKMVKGLLDYSSYFCISRVIEIPPVGMNSHRNFLNAVAYLESPLDAVALKSLSNTIEIDLGRDRTDPRSKFKDRPADIDILCVRSRAEIIRKTSIEITDEYFLYPILTELQAFLTNQPLPNVQLGVSIAIDDSFFGQTATTIDRNTDAGNKRVFQ